MSENGLEGFSRRARETAEKVLRAERYAKSGETAMARAELGKTMVSLVGLFELLNGK
ncbi:MAG: hypothetical protein JW909_02525 [Planctomycetes bacterium]|nr:hypothetical protein [Planctomycetota bacterium]